MRRLAASLRPTSSNTAAARRPRSAFEYPCNAKAWRRTPRPVAPDGNGILRTGVSGKHLDFALDTPSGYFDPDYYNFAELYFDWRDTSDNTLKWLASVGVGVEKIAGQAADEVIRYDVGVYTDFPDSPVTLKAGYYRSDAATNAGGSPGYKINQWYFAADVKF